MLHLSMNNGKALELFVYELYCDLGYSEVRLDSRISKNIDGIGISGQIDLTYKNLFLTRYVECKYRSNCNVNFDDYSKFETTLKTFNVPLYCGEIITNKKFDSKVIARCKETGITLIDIDKLKELDSKRMKGYRLGISLYNFFRLSSETSLLNAAMKYYRKFLPIEKQLSLYAAT